MANRVQYLKFMVQNRDNLIGDVALVNKQSQYQRGAGGMYDQDTS